jgi:hypothetical protein
LISIGSWICLSSLLDSVYCMTSREIKGELSGAFRTAIYDNKLMMIKLR